MIGCSTAFSMILTPFGHFSSNSLFLGWRRRWKSDGLNDPIGMAYTVLEIKEMPLFTRVFVDVGGPPDNMDDIRRTHPEDVSIWW